MDAGLHGGACGHGPEFHFRSGEREKGNLSPQSGTAGHYLRHIHLEVAVGPLTFKRACLASLACSIHFHIRFGRAIRRIREELKINQEEAAERCGLHRTYYSGVERGVRNVSLVNIEKIAKGLKKSVSKLFGRV